MVKRKSESSSKNPLSNARKGADLWHRKSGVGFSLFVEYYGGQPKGTVCRAEVPTKEAADSVKSAQIIGGSGMSRAAKKRRKKKGPIQLDHDPSRGGPDASQKEHDSEINSLKHSATLQKTVTTTTTFAPSTSKSSSQLIDAFRNQTQHGHLTPFISALAQPLPLTFRLRQNDALGKSHRKSLRDAQRDLEANFSKFVRPVPWDETVYQSVDNKISKSTLSKHCSKLKEFLVASSSKAIIARQELGSMLPVVGLTAGAHLKPGHRVLDTCASPGSKTLQALEAVAAIGEDKNSGEQKLIGKVIANDIHPQRVETLQKAIGRSGLPSSLLNQIIYTNHDASIYPLPMTKSKAPDVIVVDVPCSGDGTARKDSHILPAWSPSTAHALHPLQLKILIRALELAKVGGVVSYSTCSLNPIENEAVVRSALLACQGGCDTGEKGERAVELLEWPCPKGLLLQKGLTTWRVASYSDSSTNDKKYDDDVDGSRLTWHKSYTSATEAGMNELTSTMWPAALDKNECSEDGLNLDRCRRLLPQDQDTGGFFVALIRKNGACPMKQRKAKN
jgi:16S rRNA C967 or C1407 C5-methylase (RsmB/RsmF family)